MSKNYGNSGSPLAQYETIIVGAYKENMEELVGKNCLKFIVLLSYHDQISKGILAAASEALKTTVKSSTERENITTHLEKCLGTQLSVFINKNKSTLDRDLEECKRATQKGVEYFESNFQKRLERLPSTVSDHGDVDEYIDTLVRKSTSKTLKHLEKTCNNINEKELTFRIEDLVNDRRKEVSDTVFKTVAFTKVDSRILKHTDVNINIEKKEEKLDGSQSENSDSEESSKWTGEKNGVLDEIKSNDNNILIQQQAQLSQYQQPHAKLLQQFQTQQEQQPQDQLQQKFWTQQQQQSQHQQIQPQHQQQQPQHQQQQPQHQQQQPQHQQKQPQHQQKQPQHQQKQPQYQQQQSQHQQQQPQHQQQQPPHHQQQPQHQQQQPQHQQQQPQHQQQQSQTQHQQQPMQPDSPIPDHKTPPLTRKRQQEQQKPPNVPLRQKNSQTQLPHQQQLEDIGNNHQTTPQLSYPINPQVDTKHRSQEDKGDKNKPIKVFRHAVSSIKKDFKNNVSKLGNLVGEVTRKEPNTNNLGPAVVPLSNLYKTGVRAHSPEEVMQTTKLTSKEMNQMSTFSGEKQPTIGFLITNSRVYVLQRTADQMLGVVRSFRITLSFECPKIELNGNVNQVLVEFNVLDLLGTNRPVYIDRYEVAAEDLICEYFCQIALKIVEDNITNENAIIIQSAHLSNFQTQRLKAVLNEINFQSQQLMSLHSLVASSLCQNLGKGSPAETYLIIHFTNKEFEAAVASVSYSSANILGYADYRDIPDFNVNSQLFLHNHRELCSKAATNSNPASDTITKAMNFYNQILEKALTALKPQQSQMIKTVYIVIERNLSPLKQYLKTRLALLKNRTIEAIFEDEVLGTTGLPSVPCDDLYKHNLWILLNNATSKLRLLEKSKPFPRKEFTKEFQLPLPPLQPTFDLFSSNDERKSYRFESDYSKPLKLMLTAFADGTYHIRFKNPTDQFISFHDFPSS